MYIDITIDLTHYNGSVFDLRLSDYHSVKKSLILPGRLSMYPFRRVKAIGSEWSIKKRFFPENKSYLTAALRTETALKFYERTWWNDRS